MRNVTLACVIGAILLLSLTTFAVVPVVSSAPQLTTLLDKPSWAGQPGGQSGGGDDDEPTTYELHIEIDYLAGHEPTPAVLDYVVSYYDAHGISVTFYMDGYADAGEIDESDAVAASEVGWDAADGLTSAEIMAIEAVYNDVTVQDDRADGAVENGEYFLAEKWVFFGSTYQPDDRVMGLTTVLISAINPRKADVLAGNYIFIADAGTNTWSDVHGLDPRGAEAVVLMHELGHSIGIGIVEWNIWYGAWIEVYDSDTFSVMSTLNVYNSGNLDDWYYSDKYWKTRNMNYYEAPV